jgi:hypothetical protein
MKRIIQLVTLFVALFAAKVAQGETFSKLDGFGSLEAATDYARRRVSGVSVDAFQDTSDNRRISICHLIANKSFQSKEELDSYLLQRMQQAAEAATTNTTINRNLPVTMFALAKRASARIGSINYFAAYGQIQLIKDASGSYHVPDLSGIKFQIANSLIWEFDDQLEFGRIEVADNPLVYPYDDPRIFFEIDSRFEPGDPPDEINLEGNFIQIRTERVIAGTNSPTLIKVSLCFKEGNNHAFSVLGPFGTAAETPITTKASVTSGIPCVVIGGGDAGRVVRVQRATDMCSPSTWVDVGTQMVIPRYGGTLKFQDDNFYNSNGFYRVRSVNAIPY